MLNQSTVKKEVTITIDGRTISAPYRAPLIEVTRSLGIQIPTLCHHDALEPAGVCRLCLVEEVRDGWSKFVTACNYPIDEGMVFLTSSPEVIKNRRMTVEALLARCPDVPVIRDLAKSMGVSNNHFAQGDDTCILCGMCTRVCEAYATSAISMLNRSEDKKVGTFGGEPPEDCIGCGSCAIICPADHISHTRTEGTHEIWERTFKLAVCGVEEDKCIACGACEEACPFSIPRVVLKADGSAHAEIRPDICKVCGVCLAACPTGAVTQPRANRTLPQQADKLLVIACGRAALTGPTASQLPNGVQVIELPCTGSVNIPLLLGAVARGFSRVLVMGRHQETCRLNGAEDHARDIVTATHRLAQSLGLGDNRVMFTEPAPGKDGPVLAINDAMQNMKPTHLKAHLPSEMLGDTLEDSLAIVDWLSRQKELTSVAPCLEHLISEWIDKASLEALIQETVADHDPSETAKIIYRSMIGRTGSWRRSHKVPPKNEEQQ